LSFAVQLLNFPNSVVILPAASEMTYCVSGGALNSTHSL